MGVRRSLHDDVFASFVRACEEEEFDLAEHLLRALEFIARVKHNSEQLDAAYALLAQLGDHPQSACSPRRKTVRG
jgi:hypothetical protein